MRTAIVLAAGESRRMGTLKPLLPFGSGSVIEQVVRSLSASPIHDLLVVVGHRGDEIAEHLGRWALGVGRWELDGPNAQCPTPNASSLRVIPNPDYARGMLSSVQEGVAAADPATTLFLIALADQPSIPRALVAHLITVFEERRPGLLIPTFSGRRGHPLLIDARYRDEIAALDPDLGLRELLQRHPDDLLHLPVEVEAVVRDMDTPEEYQAEIQRWQEEQAADS
jgi:molybdenum cofactor cytidylyltransferase